jgi:hypothetical protein
MGFVFVIEMLRGFRKRGNEFLNVRRISDFSFLRLTVIVYYLSLISSDLPTAQLEYRFSQNDSPVLVDPILANCVTINKMQ